MRAVLTSRQANVAFGVSLVVVMAALEFVLRATTLTMAVKPAETQLLHVALVFVAYDMALGVVLRGALVTYFRAQPGSQRAAQLPSSAAATPAVSVLIAAWNEREHVAETVRRWVANTSPKVTFEVLVGDDGSTDGTAASLVEAFGLRDAGPGRFEGTADGVPVRVFCFSHAGKGATLNALAPHARHEVLVTVDADTTPAPHALEWLGQAFVDPEVDIATGVVTIRNGRENWLLANQAAEYLKNAFVRIAWASLDCLEQVPGAFAAIRATRFREAGGFPTDSLTEDYELTFRCIAAGLERSRAPVVVVVPRAHVLTDGPSTASGFIRQRTRWFAGFLSTLFRFRQLVFNPGAGAFGLVRLPYKLVDAVLPFLAVSALVVLVRDGVVAALGLTGASFALFAARWLWDVFVYACAKSAAWRLGSPELNRAASPPPLVGWALTAFEALTFVWLKHASALRGVLWAVRRVRTWETSREAASAETEQT